MCRRISSHAIDYPGDSNRSVSHPLRRDSRVCPAALRVQLADPSPGKRSHSCMLQPFFAWKQWHANFRVDIRLHCFWTFLAGSAGSITAVR